MKITNKNFLSIGALATAAGLGAGAINFSSSQNSKPTIAQTQSLSINPNVITFDTVRKEQDELAKRVGLKAAGEASDNERRALEDFSKPHALHPGSQSFTGPEPQPAFDEIRSSNDGQIVTVTNSPIDFIPKWDEKGLTIFGIIGKHTVKMDSSSRNRFVWDLDDNDVPKESHEYTRVRKDFTKATRLVIDEPLNSQHIRTINLEGVSSKVEVDITTGIGYTRIVVPGGFKSDLLINAKGPVDVLVLGQAINSPEVSIPGNITIKNLGSGSVSILPIEAQTVKTINEISRDEGIEYYLDDHHRIGSVLRLKEWNSRDPESYKLLDKEGISPIAALHQAQ